MSKIKELEKEIGEAFKKCGYVTEIELCQSNRPDLGEYQINDAMKLAKKYHKSPVQIANEVVEELKKNEDLTNINIAGAGFINISLSNNFLSSFINQISNNRESNIDKKEPKKIVLDYGGANVAKALHVGHLRSANIGEALKRLSKELGCEVISDIHLGDWGRPMGLIILELKKRHPNWVYFDENYRGEYPPKCPIKNNDLEQLYPIASIKAKEDEDYLNEARIITTKLQQKERGYYELWKQIVSVSVNDIKKIYNRLNVSFDLWNGESDADKYVPDVIKYLKDMGLVYENQGALVMNVDLPGDTSPIPPLLIVKSNGAISYQTTDLATLWERMKNIKPDEIWYVVDKRQSLHFKQVFRAAYKAKIVPENVKLNFIGFGTMNGKNGKPFKTRDGGVMTLSELIESVKRETLKKLNPNIIGQERDEISDIIAVSALKYADLLPNRSTDYIFDEEKFSDLNGKTGAYLLYSTIRIKSLLNKAKEQGLQIGPINVIANEYDRNIALKLLQASIVLNKSYEEKSLHDIAEYLYQLTNVFNNFYSSNRILSEKNKEIQQSWLGLTENIYNTNKELLKILGINTPKKM